MQLRDVLKAIDGKVITADVDLDISVQMGCGADLMSDVLAFTHADTLLLTGLTNPQVVVTAEIVGIVAIVFVRGKHPPVEPEAIEDGPVEAPGTKGRPPPRPRSCAPIGGP